MTPERWQKIDKLLDEVLELPEAARENFLAEKCNADNELKLEIQSLLKAHESADKFIEDSAIKVVAKNLANETKSHSNSDFLGKTFDSYKIEKLIGEGGMGEVYLAFDEKLKRKVAVKVLSSEYTANNERVSRFEREARAISALNHPNIVTIFDVGKFENINYIATEFVIGKILREYVTEGINLRGVLNVVIQCCDALSTAHNAGIIHRDIKPENIIVRPDGYVKILDFGLAKLADSPSIDSKDFAKTAKGTINGTPSYMSPEQISDERADHRTDLWSLGLVLYELVTGVNPFKKKNRQKTFQAILSSEPPLASSLNSEIPLELDRILVKVLEKDAELRYQSAADLRSDLMRIKREIDSSPSWSSQSSANSIEFAHRKKNYFLSALGVIFLILIGLGVWFFVIKSDDVSKKEAVEWVNAKHSQITDSPWIEGYPSLSPDGRNIIFASDPNNDRNIYLQRIGGKNLTNLTPNSKENDTMPTFSPNGKSIAFRSERNPSGIYVMEETGENARRVSDTGFHPSWSPDATKIVVSDKAAAVHTVHTIPNGSLWVIDVASGEKEKIETMGDAIMPNWSPNGDRIAFWFVADGQLPEIATIPAMGGEPVLIASDAASDWNPIWSPDGKYLYFGSDRSGNMNLWRVAIDEKTGAQLGEPESVPTPSKYCRHITFSRDGKTLAYVRYESQSNVQSIAFDPKTLKTSGEINWITRGDRELGNPQLSPDGEQFVARNPTRTQEDLAIFDKNGENWRNLMDDKFRERIPRWSPDGRQIAFHSDRSGKYQIWTINSDGTNLQQITFTDKISATAPVFSPDGLRLAFTEVEDQKQTSLIIDLTKNWSEQSLQTLPPFLEKTSFSVRDWSPDGKKLLYIYFEPDGDESGIGVFDFESSKYEKMTDYGSTPFWLNDNRHFIFTSQNTVFLCDSITKKVAELYKTSAYELQHAGISSDNQMIFFRYLQVNADVWLIDASEQNQ